MSQMCQSILSVFSGAFLHFIGAFFMEENIVVWGVFWGLIIAGLAMIMKVEVAYYEGMLVLISILLGVLLH
jgi:hypothetical protein